MSQTAGDGRGDDQDKGEVISTSVGGGAVHPVCGVSTGTAQSSWAKVRAEM